MNKLTEFNAIVLNGYRRNGHDAWTTFVCSYGYLAWLDHLHTMQNPRAGRPVRLTMLSRS